MEDKNASNSTIRLTSVHYENAGFLYKRAGAGVTKNFSWSRINMIRLSNTGQICYAFLNAGWHFISPLLYRGKINQL
jgi:hypothetical protein